MHSAAAPVRTAGDPIGVLIVDDSVVARAVLGRAVDASDRFVVVGAVPDAAAARAFLARHRAEIVLLDLEMPGVDGLTALPGLIAASDGARVLVVSSTARQGAAVTVQALALGAADTLEKPGIGSIGHRFGEMLIERLERLVASDEPAAAPLARAPIASNDPYDIVAIGASTGGIHALSQLLREIPVGFRLPILVTQHLPPTFMPYFAAQLAVLANRPCEVASDRLRIRPGRILVAPGEAHIRVVKLTDGEAAIRLTQEPSLSGCTPSVDPMLESVAEVFGPRALAIVLSGMGRDGASGAARIAARGGSVVVQDQASSVVWGMPGAVAREGSAHAILPPDEIGMLVAQRRRPSC